eukprot:6834232-Alexandrium_andersonii.AAC.1
MPSPSPIGTFGSAPSLFFDCAYTRSRRRQIRSPRVVRPRGLRELSGRSRLPQIPPGAVGARGP